MQYNIHIWFKIDHRYHLIPKIDHCIITIDLNIHVANHKNVIIKSDVADYVMLIKFLNLMRQEIYTDGVNVNVATRLIGPIQRLVNVL